MSASPMVVAQFEQMMTGRPGVIAVEQGEVVGYLRHLQKVTAGLRLTALGRSEENNSLNLDMVFETA